MELWDPVGVRDAPEAQNEYDTYAAGIIDRLHGGADAVVAASRSRLLLCASRGG
jgi:hypothetical protein